MRTYKILYKNDETVRRINADGFHIHPEGSIEFFIYDNVLSEIIVIPVAAIHSEYWEEVSEVGR